MLATLRRRFNPLPWLVLFLALLGSAPSALATHLLGGEMTYRYLDANGPSTAPHRYELTTSVYVACSNSNTSLYLDIDFFNKATGAHLTLTSANAGSTNASIYSGALELTQSSIGTCTTIQVPPGCSITGASQPYQLQKFVGIVCLPAATAGYYALTAPSGGRNTGITNLANGASSNYNLTLYTTLAPPTYANHSPVFTGDAVGLICSGDTTVVLNNAVDADGDRLVYAFGQPYTYPASITTFAPPPAYVPYTTTGGYSAATPLGTGAGYYAKINASTGITKYLGGPTVGNRYGIAVDVTEYRTINGVEVALGTTRRDIQLLVGSCPPTVAPALPAVAAMPRSYTIEAGSTLSIPIAGTQPAAHPLTLTATSALLDGNGGYNATFAGNAGTPTYAGSPVGAYTVTGTTGGTVAGTFVFAPTCTQARATPYDVTLVLRDIGCAGKIASDVLRITVVKPTGPTNIAGTLTVCGLNGTQTYTASGGTAPSVQWTVTGGTIVGSATANPVTVRWPTAGTGTVTAQGVTQYGCLVEMVTKSVIVSPTPVLTVTGNLTICQGSSTTLTVAGGGSGSYLLTGGAAPVMVTNPFVVSPTQTTTYTITPAVLPANGCPPTAQVTVTVVPRPVANAGAAVSICAGGTAQLGASPVSGLAYSWSPATGLSNASVANPTVTLPNPTGAAITQTYTLTATDPATGCQTSSTVLVTVSPPAVATAGAAVAFCSGGSAQLGASPVSGLAYSWSPATGLSSSTVANPTVTLTNTNGAAITQTYTLTVTSPGGCASTGTVAVTVNPLPVVAPGAPVSFCSGGTAQLGASPVSGLAYNWSPATGLSNATVANPTVRLTNTTGTPVSQTYTLTVTNAAGCASTGTVAVTVNPLPTATAGAAVALCSGGTAQLGASPVLGLAYSWSPATGLSSATVANPTLTLTNTTSTPITQTYTLTVTSATGCVSTATVAATVNPLPVAAPGTAVAFCSGASATLGAAPVSGLTYSWSPVTGLSNATAANPAVTLTNTTTAPLTRTYTLTVANAAGCTSTGTVAVTVNPLPAAAAGAAVAFCSGGTGQLGASPVSGLAYSWSPATGLSSSTVANPTVTLTNTTNAASTQTYTLTVTNATGCTSTATVAVTVNPQPVVAVMASSITICSGGAGQLGVPPVAGNSYSWSPATGLSSSTVANPTITLTNPTSFVFLQMYTLTVTGVGGCTSTGSVAVAVQPALTPGTIGADQTVCAGSVPTLLTSTAAAGGGLGAYAYQWESSPDNLTWTALANVTGLTCAPGPVAATTYFRRRVTAGTCGAAYSNVVAVTTQPLLVPAVALPVLPAQCAGTAFTFTPVPTNAGAAPTYQWLVNGAAVGTGPTYTSASLADGDIVRVVLTPTAGFCASGTAIATVRVSLTPVLITSVAISTSTALPVCPGNPITFGLDAAANVGTSPQYQWQVDGVNVAGATSPGFTSATLRDGQKVTLIVRSTNACGQPATATSNAVRVTINQPAQLSAGPDKTIMEGETVVLEGTADGNYPVTWSPAQTLTFAAGNQLRPVAVPLATTTYTLSAGAGFCGSSSTVTVTVLPRVRIPNAFSPNGDNNDDTWQIDNIGQYTNNRVVVFNRWGTKVFESANYSRGSEWNGTINGQPAPFGTYYYLITLGNGKSYTGPITVIN